MTFKGLITSFVVFLFLMSPSEIFWDFSFYNAHPYGITYKLWSGGINIFDIIFSLILIFKLFTTNKINVKILKITAAWVAINAFGFAILIYNGHSPVVYYDGALLAVRVIVFGLVTSFWIEDSGVINVLKVVSSSIVILATISIAVQTFLGYSGTVDSRLNMLGMGPNISSDLAILSIVVIFYLLYNEQMNKTYGLICASILFLYLPLSGSRRFIIYALIFLTMHLYAIGARRALVLSFSAFTVIFTVASMGGINLLFSGTSIESRLYETIGRYQAGGTLDGRLEIYPAVLSLLSDNPFGLGNSDWLIQDQLVPYGFSSHTHNIFFQFYLKYGPLSIFALFWVFLAAVRLSKHSAHLLAIVVILALINLTGHSYWNQKALFVHIGLILSIYSLSQQWAVRSSGTNLTILKRG